MEIPLGGIKSVRYICQKGFKKEVVRVKISKKALAVGALIVALVFIATACSSITSKQTAQRKLPLSIVSVSSSISPGATISVFAKTEPGATCEINPGYKGGSSEAQSLAPKKAEANGLVMWTWSVDPAARLGKYPLTITAKASDGQIASTKKIIEIKSVEECNK